MAKTSWLERLSENLDRTAGEDIRSRILQGSEDLSSGSAPGTKARWVCGMLERLEALTDEDTGVRVMTACHCLFPQPVIHRLKNLYDKTRQVDLIVDTLQANRREEIQRRIGKDELLWEKAKGQPFFTSPLQDGNRIIHITAPYHPWAYLQESDFMKKRAHYCHCGWINGSKENISQTFCYCGAGYYKTLWEGVLEKPVEVKILRTIFNGDDDCRIQVMLPDL